MYEVNKEYKNILYFAFNVSLVAVNNQASLFTEIQAHVIVAPVCVVFDWPRVDKFWNKRIFSQKLFEYCIPKRPQKIS
jgi:hypothetical protein